MIIFNEEIEDIIDIKHICYYTKNEGQYIKLIEVIEKKLKHPKVKDLTYVQKYDTRTINKIKRIESESAQSILLEAAQNNIKIGGD
jgi:hypothetical protein